MSKRYASVSSLGAETPMPLLDWLIHELDMDQNEMRNVGARWCYTMWAVRKRTTGTTTKRLKRAVFERVARFFGSY